MECGDDLEGQIVVTFGRYRSPNGKSERVTRDYALGVLEGCGLPIVKESSLIQRGLKDFLYRTGIRYFVCAVPKEKEKDIVRQLQKRFAHRGAIDSVLSDE